MHKLDLMGIGANRVREGDEGRQGREYENLLKRLNENSSVPRVHIDDSDVTSPETNEDDVNAKKEKKKRKRESEPEESNPPPKTHVPRPMA